MENACSGHFNAPYSCYQVKFFYWITFSVLLQLELGFKYVYKLNCLSLLNSNVLTTHVLEVFLNVISCNNHFFAFLWIIPDFTYEPIHCPPRSNISVPDPVFNGTDNVLPPTLSVMISISQNYSPLSTWPKTRIKIEVNINVYSPYMVTKAISVFLMMSYM